jgi:DNA-binding response OmpR family regulator
VLDAGIAYVQKPFSMHVVAGKIREVLTPDDSVFPNAVPARGVFSC